MLYILLGFSIVGVLGDQIPVVHTSLGKILGYLKRSYDGGVFSAFEGIAYAKPPVGDLRFEAPKSIQAWRYKVLNATVKYTCKQIDTEFATPGNGNGTEDCLYLNVYVPKHQPSKDDNFDVIVNIHGGAFMTGDGTAAGPGYLMDRKVVYVSINYRLGILGFLSTEDTIVPGNNGLKDQQLALKWVQRHISNFGGNPKSVTLMGLSAGGASVHFHYFSPQSKDLFHKAISHSGTALMPWALQEGALEKTKKLAILLDCQNLNIKSLINCLKQVPVDELVLKTYNFYGFKQFPLSPFAPVVEVKSKTSFLTKHPYKQLENGEINDVPWLTWITKDEGLFGLMITGDSIKELNFKWNDWSEYMFDYQYTVPKHSKSEIAHKIKSFYFQNNNISESNINSLVKAVGDRLINVGFDLAVQMQTKVSQSAVYAGVYGFLETSIKFLQATGLTFEGVPHGADALLLHDSPILQFAEKNFSKSEEYIKNLLLDFVASFAKDGKPKAAEVVWNRMAKDSNYLFIYDQGDIKMVEVENISNKNFWESLNILENSKTEEIRDEL